MLVKTDRLWLYCLVFLGAGLQAACSTSLPSTAPISLVCASPDAPAFRLLGEVRWDASVQFAGTPVGGLSGIDYLASDNRYYLVSDDRSQHDAARIYSASIRYSVQGLQQVSLEQVHYLRTPTGTYYPNQRTATADTAVPDPEALRILPGGRSLVWSSEGDFARGFGPSLHEARLNGEWLRDWPLPSTLQLPKQPSPSHGPRNNLTLEGIAISDDQQTLWLAMEAPLKQDGPLPRKGLKGGPIRLTAYDIASRQPIRQIAYRPDALDSDPFTLPLMAINGVSEILADGPDHLLVLERAFVLGSGFSARLYRIATQGAEVTDTLLLDTLTPDNHRPAHKTLLVDFSQLGLQSVDNLEAMTWGAPLASGERVLLVVSDNNFNPAEVTQFVALAQVPGCMH